MFNFLRNLTKSAEEKRQETVAAYLDGALSDRERQRFEQEMAQDVSLQAEVEQLHLVKQSLRQLPQRQVPRNFMLDPVTYGRPAPQPWVQAYPVLRTATALAAFFFIFAVVAGVFTGLGVGNELTFAPAADIAQSESVVVTRVTTELTESFAAEADADDAAGEQASEDMAEESAEEFAEEAVAESAAAIEAEAEPVEDEAEEMVEEEEIEAAGVETTQPAMASPLAPETTDSLQEGDAEDGAEAPQPQGTVVVAPTPTLSPTPTVSTLPRVTPPTPLPDRDPELPPDADEAANDTLADVPDGGEEIEETGEDTAVTPEETDPETGIQQPTGPLSWLQLGLGILLLLLASLTFYARGQR